MPRRRRLAGLASLIAAALTVGAPTPAAAHAAGTTAAAARGGSLVLVGGGLADDNKAIYDDIVRLAGGPGRARIGVVTAAAPVPSEDPDAGTPDCNNSVCNGEYYAALFRRYGAAAAEWVPIDSDRPGAADDPAVVAQVESMTGFFFGGGDQFRYVRTLTRGETQADSRVLAAVRAKLRAGAVVAGVSAGAQIQAGRDMVTGGTSYTGLRDGSRRGYFEDPDVLGYLPRGGFGFFTAGQVDTHFAQRGRQGRAVRLAADTGHDRVFGLDPNTALEVTGVGTSRESMRVLGEFGVSVLDLRRARTGTDGGRWSVDGVRWTYLTDGDSYAPADWQPRVAADKRRVHPARTCRVPEASNVFGYFVLVDLAVALAEHGDCRSVAGRSAQSGPAFRVELRRGAYHAAYRAGKRTSFTDVVLRIRAG